ncbi:hypothetical protein KUCAC02_017076, partial [Chaenocephalus aceratus]
FTTRWSWSRNEAGSRVDARPRLGCPAPLQADAGPKLVQFWANAGLTVGQYWANTGSKLGKYWANTGSMLAVRRDVLAHQLLCLKLGT